MTLDEAIARAENVADEQNKIVFALNTTYNAVTEYSKECSKCAEDHRQLAGWLKDYKRLKKQEPCDDTAKSIATAFQFGMALGFTEKCGECDDCINRQAVLKLQYRIDDSSTLSTRDVVNVEDIEDLPSVTPKEKTGHWIDKDIRGSIEPYCSVCGDSVDTIYHYNYCPNCGAKMEADK